MVYRLDFRFQWVDVNAIWSTGGMTKTGMCNNSREGWQYKIV